MENRTISRYLTSRLARSAKKVAVAGLIAATSVGVLPSSAAAWTYSGLEGRSIVLCADGINQCTARADGSDEHHLTNFGSGIATGSSDWSPDGRRIVLTTTADGGDNDIYIVNDDGTGLTQLTFNSALDSQPIFSPDGTKVAYFSNVSGAYRGYVMNTDGTNPTLVSPAGVSIQTMDWSPDGTQLLAYSNGPVFSIYRINLSDLSSSVWYDGPGMEFISRHSWSSATNQVLVGTDRNDGTPGAAPLSYDLYRLNADGTGEIPLVTNPVPYTDAMNGWADAGSRVRFSTYDTTIGTSSVQYFTSAPDGSDIRPITRLRLSPQPLTVAPSVNDDTVVTPVESTATIDILANDDGTQYAFESIDTTSVTITAQPSHGTAAVNPDGTISYTRTANDPATSDSFTYQACSTANAALCSTATATLTLSALPSTSPSGGTGSGSSTGTGVPTVPNTGISQILGNPALVLLAGLIASGAVVLAVRRRARD